VKIAVAASEMPHPQGTAAGRDLWAWCEAVRDLGHELDAWIWYRSPSSPDGPVPGWARYEPLEIGPLWRAHLRALLVPRNEAARIAWEPDPEAVIVADHLPSAAAVLGRDRSVVTLHYRAFADARSVGWVRPADLQTARAERRAARRADLVLAYSDRIGKRLPRNPHFVPITYPVPRDPLPIVDEPVAALMADWAWRPNLAALHRLLRLWPAVREALPSAVLVLAGRNLPVGHIGPIEGVEVLGPVAESTDVLSRAAVVAFPCPNSSGPKVKTLEALAYGIPVLTSPSGMEGIGPGNEALSDMTTGPRRFAARLAQLLADPEERRRLGAAGRAAVSECHAPVIAARTRIALFEEAFGL
jgi:glycosyltransferase involved in cell wall biosynthesis